MARRRRPRVIVVAGGEMPEELRGPFLGHDRAFVDRWLQGEKYPAEHVGTIPRSMWRQMAARQNRARAIREWRAENDPTDWWYKRRPGGLPARRSSQE